MTRGLGDSAQAQSAVGYATMGAKAGSIVPGIGTVIGAVVGAVVGWLAAKKKPIRPTAEEIAACKSLVGEYMGYAEQMPNQPIPLDQEQLRKLNWCIDALYGSKVGLKDPRFFDPDVAQIFIPMARQIVKLIYSTPVGGTINLDSLSASVRGQKFTFKGFSFVNPTFTNLKTFCDQYFIPIAVQMCKDTAGKGAGGCESYYGQQPEFKRWLYDLLGWAARTELPNISESDLAAASQVATSVPGSSARDVVTAVEQIIGRTVQSGETAAVLTPSTGPPPALPIVPTGSPTTAPPASGVVPPPIVTPGIPPAQTLPASPFPLPPTTGIVSPFSPYAPEMPVDSFQIQPIGTAKQTTPATATASESLFSNPYVLGGLLAVGGLVLYTRRRR